MRKADSDVESFEETEPIGPSRIRKRTRTRKKISRKTFESKRFQISLSQFDQLCTVTNLRIQNIDWPLINGPPVFLQPLISHTLQISERTQFTNFTPDTLVRIISNMMFGYGDSPSPNPEAAQFLLQKTIEILVAYCNDMWKHAFADGRRIIDHTDLLNLISRHPARFQRFIRFIFTTQNQFSTPPPIVNHLTQLYTQDEHFREFCNTEIRDDHFLTISARFNITYQTWSDRQKELWAHSRMISFCCPSDQLSPFFAYRFHEALGLPPLETDLIYYIDYIAREYIMEVVYRAIRARDTTHGWAGTQSITINDYISGIRNEGDILFNNHVEVQDPNNHKKPSSSTFLYTSHQFYKLRVPQNRQRFEHLRMNRLQEQALEEIRHAWWQRHQAPPVPRLSFDPLAWYKMRKR